MSVFGRYTVVISDDSRYEKGKTYDLALDTSVTPDPATVISASVDTSPADMTVATAQPGG